MNFNRMNFIQNVLQGNQNCDVCLTAESNATMQHNIFFGDFCGGVYSIFIKLYRPVFIASSDDVCNFAELCLRKPHICISLTLSVV